MVTQIYRSRFEIWVASFPKIWQLKNIKISAILWLDRKYLRNVTRYRQSENGVANYGHSCRGKLNLVYFGPQTAKITDGYQAMHLVMI